MIQNELIILPKVVTLEELVLGQHESILVSINSVQFQETISTFSGVKNLSNCTQSLPIYTRPFASFAEESLPNGNGAIVGVVSRFNDPQLLIREVLETVEMTGERCE